MLHSEEDREKMLLDLFSLPRPPKLDLEYSTDLSTVDGQVIVEPAVSHRHGANLGNDEVDNKKTEKPCYKPSPLYPENDEIANILLPNSEPGEEDMEEEESVELEEDDHNDNETEAKSIEDEIRETISILMAIDEMGELTNLKPSFLIDRAHWLCNGRKYENVYGEIINSGNLKTDEEVQRLERINAMLTGFISAERKSRSRLKVNLILSRVVDKNLFEEVIETLSLAEEIDDDLFLYLRSLKEAERKRRKGLEAMMELSDEPSYSLEFDSINALQDQSKRDTIIEREIKQNARNSRESKESTAFQLLDLIEKRLKAEILDIHTKREVKLLSDLLQQITYEERISKLKETMRKIEDIYSFESFIEDGLNYMQNQHRIGRNSATTEDPVKVIERMKGLLEDIKQYTALLRSGGTTTSSEIFSTFSDEKDSENHAAS